MMTTTAPAPSPPAVNLENVTDLDQAMRVCEQLALSDIVPAALRSKPANVLVVYLTGRELGLSFAQALRTIYVPSGGQPQLRGSLLLAKIREAGHKYRWEYSEDGNTCTFWIKRADDQGEEPHESFSLDDALLAGLVRKAPNGDVIALSQQNRPLPWMQYRHDMLFWRAVARCANRVVPEIILGFEIAGSGEVQQPEVNLKPAGAAVPAETGPPAVTGSALAEAAAELADLDTQGAGDAQGAAPGEGPESTPPPAPPTAGPGATTGTGATATSPAGDQRPGPRAGKQVLQKLGDAFAALGWTMAENKAEIMNACTVSAKRPIHTPAGLTNPEATRLATELGKVMRTTEPEHYLVALSDAIDGWEHDWEEDDPAAYEAYKAQL